MIRFSKLSIKRSVISRLVCSMEGFLSISKAKIFSSSQKFGAHSSISILSRIRFFCLINSSSSLLKEFSREKKFISSIFQRVILSTFFE